MRLPFEIGKNLTGGLAVIGIGVTAVFAYLWLVEKVNAGGLNMIKLNAQQLRLESMQRQPDFVDFLNLSQIYLYKNIDIATLASGATTVATGFAYLIFKSFADTLK